MSISISINIVFPISPLFFDIMSSYFSHSCSKAALVFGEVFLSSKSTLRCAGTSAGDLRKSSFFLMNGFSNSSESFSSVFISGIQFLGSSCSSSSIVHSSSTSPLLLSCCVNATTWSFGRCKYSLWLKLTMMKGVVSPLFFSLRSAINGYVQMFGFEFSQSSSSWIST